MAAAAGKGREKGGGDCRRGGEEGGCSCSRGEERVSDYSKLGFFRVSRVLREF